MDHPVLVPSNNGNGSLQNHDQTCTKQPPATTRHKESTSITQESDPSSSLTLMTFYKLHLDHLQFWNIKPIKQNGTITACKTIHHTGSLK